MQWPVKGTGAIAIEQQALGSKCIETKKEIGLAQLLRFPPFPRPYRTRVGPQFKLRFPRLRLQFH